MADFPWYQKVDSNILEQGDIFRGYPLFVLEITADTIQQVTDGEVPDIPMDTLSSDVIVVSQTCDLLNDKIDTVILCPVISRTKRG